MVPGRYPLLNDNVLGQQIQVFVVDAECLVGVVEVGAQDFGGALVGRQVHVVVFGDAPQEQVVGLGNHVLWAGDVLGELDEEVDEG